MRRESRWQVSRRRWRGSPAGSMALDGGDLPSRNQEETRTRILVRRILDWITTHFDGRTLRSGQSGSRVSIEELNILSSSKKKKQILTHSVLIAFFFG